MKSSFCPLLFLLPRLYPEDLIHILLHGPVVDHLSAKGLILRIVFLLLRQQSGVLFGKLGHFRDGLAAQGVKGLLRRLMFGDLIPMLRQKFLLVAGLFIGGVDLAFIVIRNYSESTLSAGRT